MFVGYNIEVYIHKKLKNNMSFKEFCLERLNQKNFMKDQRYLKRLEWELKEIEIQDKESYFLDLFNKNKKYKDNQNNLLVPYLLDIVDSVNIDVDPAFYQGDMPDIDTDYLPAVRDYLKNEWSIKTFGEDKVCNIGNYTTFGIKNSLIDIAKVCGESREEILNITKNLQNKDDEGKPVTWDTAIRQDPLLKKYCEDKQNVAVAARKLINRNRGMGVHAGGLIISSIPINDIVPLVKRKDDPQASSWVEGLHGQDLQPVGLVKFDLLVIANLLQIAHCCRLLEERYGIKKVCALPGQNNWSNVEEYRNDKKSLDMANSGDLKCIFQFDSDGIRSLVKAGGVTRFEDLVAYSSLYRPGPLNCKMHERYVERKRGRESYELHPLLKDILDETYGVIIYQEQVMKILNIIGNIPMRDVESVRKAISKKKVESFIKYKEVFIKNAKNNLGCSKEEATDLWVLLEAFSEYGFNKSHAVAYTHISARLLYLKSHYPHEFYTAILKCEDDSDKIKEYKKEIKNHGIKLNKLDINKSSDNFFLIGDEIYYGFSNVKGIGKVAEDIVKLQPFSGFQDFIERFGTDATVLKPLLASKCFNENTPVNLFKFAEYYKKFIKKKEDSKNRYLKNSKKNKDELIKLIDIAENSDQIKQKVKSGALQSFNFSFKQTTCQEIKDRYKDVVLDGKNAWKQMCKVLNKIQSARKRFIEKINYDKPKLEAFDFNSQKIDSKIEKELSDSYESEKKTYGFCWDFKIEKSKDFQGGMTFDKVLELEEGDSLPVEVEVLSVNKRKGKKTEYYQVKAQDCNGDEGVINIWKDEYEIYQEELQHGNFLRIRLHPPTNGFKTFTLENLGRKNYFSKIKINKSDDYRIFLMQKTDIE
jgi:DNA polymerase III alpha subunit